MDTYSVWLEGAIRLGFLPQPMPGSRSGSNKGSTSILGHQREIFQQLPIFDQFHCQPDLVFESRVDRADCPSFQSSCGSTLWSCQDDLPMMPHQSNPNGVPRAATVPEVRLDNTHNKSLRTYSRRSLKRRHTSPPAQHVGRFLTRAGSLNVTERKTTEQSTKAKPQQLSRPSPKKDHKRVGFSNSTNKTPNDLAWEALASSAPVPTRQDYDSPDDGRLDKALVVKCSPGQRGSEHQRLPVRNALNGPIRGREGSIGGEANSEADIPDDASLEESDGFEDGEELWALLDQDHC